MSALDELSLRCGIVPSYRDARGETRHTSPQTRIALLGAMGIEAHDELTATAQLRRLDEREWRRVLPPVCVLYASEPAAVSVNLPLGTDMCSWRLTLENGSVDTGETPFGALQRIAECPLTHARETRRLELGTAVPVGYHKLSVQPEGGETLLIVSPGDCWLPEAMGAGQRMWGVAAQVYLLRSALDWGIGDYRDLRQLVEIMARYGADVIGVNPLHAVFLDDPEQASPYSPASRLLLNVLNIDVASVPEVARSPLALAKVQSADFAQELARCRAAPLVDYRSVAGLKLASLRLAFDDCVMRGAIPSPEFSAFRSAGGASFERGCVFLALREHFAGLGAADWHAWPEEFHNPESKAVSEFGREHARAVTFQVWLQFLADGQLAAAAKAAESMRVGLYRDLAVGADRAGAETWANQAAVVDHAQVGAPPDIYNPAGQDWGLPPFNPRELREEAYRSFIELLRANMRHAGGLRIDHVMALQQLYWVPRGKSPSEGAYVQYPLRDLVGILALESHRHRCLVVGEDLGTVPEGFRERMAAARILSYRVLFFEKSTPEFHPPESYPTLALAVAGSHDLPTLRGWWEGSDIVLKDALQLYPQPADRRAAEEERKTDRCELLAAFRRAGLPSDANMTPDALVRGAHAYLARSPAALAVVQLDDITDEGSPVNVPATSYQHPNWRRRQSLTLEEIDCSARLAMLADVFRQERSNEPHRS